MAASKRVLALNVGASKMALAEFQLKDGQMPELVNYGVAELGAEQDGETDLTPYIVSGISDIMRDCGIKPAPLLMSLSGQSVFPRYVRLPAVAKDKIQQMVRYEAEQNVPFPIDEVVWDYQLVGEAESGEQNAMIVAVKTENVVQLTDCAEAAGLEPEIVDVAPLALYNCVRHNYPDADGCTMVLDIGARSTNLVFIEEGRVFSRSIPVAGNAITNELAKNLNLGFKEAELVKRQHAIVALGGVYSMSDDEMTERVSKVVRNVVTRLHAEINRSISFYRSQQNGAPPARVLLTGGTATIPNMDTFFREKLKIDVDYLNPFVNVTVGGSVNPDQAGADFYQLAEITGLALRRAGKCPMEINLIPPKLVERRAFKARLPWFGVAGVAFVAAIAFLPVQSAHKAGLYERQAEMAAEKAEGLSKVKKAQDRAGDGLRKAEEEADGLKAIVERRTAWIRILDAVRKCLDDGEWLTGIEPVKDADGRTVALLLNGRGFDDRLKALEKAAKEQSGVDATAAELLRDRLKANPVFDETGKKVSVKNERTVDESLREFTIEAALSETAIETLAGK